MPRPDDVDDGCFAFDDGDGSSSGDHDDRSSSDGEDLLDDLYGGGRNEPKRTKDEQLAFLKQKYGESRAKTFFLDEEKIPTEFARLFAERVELLKQKYSGRGMSFWGFDPWLHRNEREASEYLEEQEVRCEMLSAAGGGDEAKALLEEKNLADDLLKQAAREEEKCAGKITGVQKEVRDTECEFLAASSAVSSVGTGSSAQHGSFRGAGVFSQHRRSAGSGFGGYFGSNSNTGATEHAGKTKRDLLQNKLAVKRGELEVAKATLVEVRRRAAGLRNAICYNGIGAGASGKMSRKQGLASATSSSSSSTAASSGASGSDGEQLGGTKNGGSTTGRRTSTPNFVLDLRKAADPEWKRLSDAYSRKVMEQEALGGQIATLAHQLIPAQILAQEAVDPAEVWWCHHCCPRPAAAAMSLLAGPGAGLLRSFCPMRSTARATKKFRQAVQQESLLRSLLQKKLRAQHQKGEGSLAQLAEQARLARDVYERSNGLASLAPLDAELVKALQIEDERLAVLAQLPPVTAAGKGESFLGRLFPRSWFVSTRQLLALEDLEEASQAVQKLTAQRESAYAAKQKWTENFGGDRSVVAGEEFAISCSGGKQKAKNAASAKGSGDEKLAAKGGTEGGATKGSAAPASSKAPVAPAAGATGALEDAASGSRKGAREHADWSMDGITCHEDLLILDLLKAGVADDIVQERVKVKQTTTIQNLVVGMPVTAVDALRKANSEAMAPLEVKMVAKVVSAEDRATQAAAAPAKVVAGAVSKAAQPSTAVDNAGTNIVGGTAGGGVGPVASKPPQEGPITHVHLNHAAVRRFYRQFLLPASEDQEVFCKKFHILSKKVLQRAQELGRAPSSATSSEQPKTTCAPPKPACLAAAALSTAWTSPAQETDRFGPASLTAGDLALEQFRASPAQKANIEKVDRSGYLGMWALYFDAPLGPSLPKLLPQPGSAAAGSKKQQ